MKRAAIVASAIFIACQFTHGVNPNGPSPDGMPPPDGGPCTDISTTCADATTLRTCATIGSAYQDTTCTWGCTLTGGAHCAELVPSGGAVTAGDAMTGTFTGVMATTLGSGSALIVDGGDGRIGTMFDSRAFRSDGTGVINGIDFEIRGNVGIFRFASLTVAGPVQLVGPNAIAFVSDGPVDIEGVIDARGPGCTDGTAGTTAGPGGFDGANAESTATGSGGGHGGANNDDGGGGGGYGGAGGPGHGHSGGTAFGDDLITVLTGGGGGGGGKDSGSGGGGGGALQLVSNAGVTIGAFGGINAGGCGGHSGGGGSHSGGGGGGAGGSILIEAVKIGIAGALAVNGGGGGGNNRGGSAGTLDRTPAPGADGGGDGAAGATSDGSPGIGNGAAGGGGIGRIRLDTLSGSATVMAGAVLSPALADATTCTQGVAVTQ